jgi:hypothetical protein
MKLFKTASPAKQPKAGNEDAASVTSQVSPMVDHFFEDQMLIRPDSPLEEPRVETPTPMDVDTDEEPSMENVMVTEEDMDLAQEAENMSHMEPEAIEEFINHNQSFDDSLSDASQEYGDENRLPIDPAIMGNTNQALSTPVRPVMKVFHTTTKVPLKPADDSTPSPLKKRSFSASRIAPKRPAAMTRSATVISYSPEKGHNKDVSSMEADSECASPSPSAPTTPTKSDLWSAIGTPARTPRRDLNSTLLRGAVAFVDVRTSDGTDASSLFIELLEQMGAQCVSEWNWDPSALVHGDASSSKIGITHVVYKDGDAQTLERVRQSNGVVHCVGVSWVLE